MQLSRYLNGENQNQNQNIYIFWKIILNDLKIVYRG